MTWEHEVSTAIKREAPRAITAATVKAAFRDQRNRATYDKTDTKGRGLQVRVKPTSVRWSVRVGAVVEGDESVGGLSLEDARTLANTASEMARKQQNPAAFLAARAAGLSVETFLKMSTVGTSI